MLTRGEQRAAAGSNSAPARPDVEVTAVARGGLANLAGAAVSAVANFALVWVVAQFLNLRAAGVFFGITSVFLIGEQVLRLGSDTGAVYFIARWRALGEPERIRPGLRAALGPILVFSLVLTAVLELVAPWLAELVSDGSTAATTQLRVLAAVIPVAVGYDLVVAATRGFRRMRPTVMLEKIARPLLQLVLVALVLAVGWHGGLAAAWCVPYIVVAFAAVAALRPLIAKLPRHAIPAKSVAREFWTFSLPRAVAGAAQVILQRLDVVLVAAIRGPREAAIYMAASRFLVLGQFLTQGIAAPVQPRLSAFLSSGDTVGARALYRISTTWIVLVGWPVFLLAAVFAPQYLGLFRGGYRTTDAVVVVVVLALSMLVATGVGVVDSVIIMAGRTSWNLWTTLLAVVINVVVDLAIIPHLGIIGAAIGWSAAILASNVVPLIVAWTQLHMHPFGRATAEAAVLSVVAFVALPLLGKLVGGLVGTIVGAVLGAALYAAIVWSRRNMFDLAGMLRARKRSGGRADARTEGQVPA